MPRSKALTLPVARWMALRRARAGMLVCVALMVSGCALGIAPAGARGVAEQVAPGVYMVRGADGEVDAANLGRIGNAGFIVGPQGVIAIDTGTSYRHGRALLAEVARVTDLPVRLVLVTHTRQEFLFGAAAYRERGIPVHMQRQAARLMAQRCEGCLKTLNRVLGEEPMRGTAMFKADVEFDDAPVLDTIGRPVRVLYFGHSSGPGDIGVLDVDTGTLFAGGLVDTQRVPDVQDSEISGWRQALKALRAVDVARVVPGHGPLAGGEAIEQVGNYLGRLETRLLELLEADVALSEVPDAAALPEYERWDQYQTIHRRNAAVLFVRMEREQLTK
jgi:glyoxylase-like metal-dependent hydrolase (beta-lactamase superfamily II)